MTTNVFDQLAGVVATDSRWSIAKGRWLVYVDDSQFDKIELYGDFAFMFAGDGRGVQRWKSWIRSNPTRESQMPEVDGIAVCVIHVPDKQVRFHEKQEIVRDGGFFAGSGARHAYRCWNTNKCAKTSVETAKGLDFCTGGEIKYYECATRAHNLSYPTVDVTIDMVNQAVTTRGMFMELTKNGAAPFKLTDIASVAVSANDAAELQEIQAKIASGDLSVEAPCDQMYNTWTADEKSKLRNVLGEVFGW